MTFQDPTINSSKAVTGIKLCDERNDRQKERQDKSNWLLHFFFQSREHNNLVTGLNYTFCQHKLNNKNS